MAARYLSCGHPYRFLGVFLVSGFYLSPKCPPASSHLISTRPSHPPQPNHSWVLLSCLCALFLFLPWSSPESFVKCLLDNLQSPPLWSIFSLTCLPSFFTQDCCSICYDSMVENWARFSLTFFSVWMASVHGTAWAPCCLPQAMHSKSCPDLTHWQV